jgi:hypothetical protein
MNYFINLSGFEKISVNLSGLKKIYKSAIKPKLIRDRGLDIIESKLNPGGPGGFAVISKKRMPSFGVAKKSIAKQVPRDLSLISPDLPDQVYGKIMAEKGGLAKSFNTLGAASGIKLPRSGKQKEIISRIGLSHELSETQVKKYQPIFGHMSPNVLFSESNLVKSLPKKYLPSKNYMLKLRTKSGETLSMEELYPGFVYGKTRVNRSGRKHVERKFKEINDEMMENFRKMQKKIGK